MTYEVTVEYQPRRDAAVIGTRVARDGIAAFLAGAYAEIIQAVQAQSVAPAGPPFARYRDAGDAFEVTAGIPVAAGITAQGRVRPGELPGGEVATTLHRGSYEGLAGAFHAVIDWITSQGRVIAADPWESHLDGPEVPEPRTIVCFPVGPEQR